MIKSLRLLLLLLSLTALTGLDAARAQTPPAGQAQPAGAVIKAATRVVPPFAMGEAASLRGFSIDLFREIAKRIGANAEFVLENSIQDLLTSPAAGRSDLAIAAISITSEREKLYDFSHPMFESGLQILVRPEGGSANSIVATLWQFLAARQMLEALALLALLILVPAHIVWFAERGKGTLIAQPYFKGILNAIFWAAGAAGGQQHDHPVSASGRFVSAMWVFVSVIFVAYFTAAVTTAMTVQQLRGSISGPDDLPGRPVATVAGSTAAVFLKRERIRATEFPGIEAALQALHTNQVEAVVYDAPVLLYHAANDGKGRAVVAGPIFGKENYGILFARGSLLRKPVNEALLHIRETGVYDSLYRKWFSAGG